MNLNLKVVCGCRSGFTVSPYSAVVVAVAIKEPWYSSTRNTPFITACIFHLHPARKAVLLVRKIYVSVSVSWLAHANQDNLK
jgi:hypothetical protein